MDDGCLAVYDRPPLFTRTFHPRRFLRLVYGTEPFAEYCQSRKIPFEQIVGFPMHEDDWRRWQEVLQALPESEQARVELELAQVNELARRETIALLLEATRERGLPPDSIPGETALALWFFLHHSDLFHEVFLRHEISEVDGWRDARCLPGIALDDLQRKQESLADSLRDFLRAHEGSGRFCAVESFTLPSALCFVAYLADRLRLLDVFTERGHYTTQPTRPAFPILFTYFPHDGKVLLKTRQRAADKILDLFQRFGRAVLGVELDGRCMAPAFRLELFKKRFEPSIGEPDIESVRVKALHLAYPERSGRRRLKLETLAGDSQFAILELLREHGGRDGTLEQMTVLYAELEVRLRVGGRSKNCVIRLWPDRCSLSQTALGERLRSCLVRWGIAYAA
jgi:hypothetical protein